MPRLDPEYILSADRPACGFCTMLTIASSIAGTAFIAVGLYAAASIGMANWTEAKLAHQEAFSSFRSASTEVGR